MKLDCAAAIISNKSRSRVTPLRLGNTWHRGLHFWQLPKTAAFKIPRGNHSAHGLCCCVLFPEVSHFLHLRDTDKGEACFPTSIFKYRHVQPFRFTCETTSICLIRRLLTFHLEILLKSKLSRLTKIHAGVRHLQHSVIEFADFSCTKIT